MSLNNISVIKADLGIEPNGKVHKFFTHTCRVHNDKYVPFDTGTLAGTVTETTDSYTYEQIYAAYVYRGISRSGKKMIFKKDKHVHACSYWDKKMVSAEMVDILKEVKNYIGRGAK